MFPYRVKYTESESDIQNNDLLYKINPKYQNTFDLLENVGKFEKEQKKHVLFCSMYKLHNSYFVSVLIFCIFCNFGIVVFLYLYVLHV